MFNKLLISFSVASLLTYSNLSANDAIDDDLGGFDTEETVAGGEVASD